MKAEVQSLLLYLQQMRGQNAYVEYVSGASSMTEMIMRIATIEQVTDHIQESMDKLDAEIKTKKIRGSSRKL